MLHIPPWFGHRVLEAPLKSCRSPRILHISTHGFFLPDQFRDSPLDKGNFGAVISTGGTVGGTTITTIMNNRLSGIENPLLHSGIALAGANTWLQYGLLPKEAEDGILTAEDISGWIYQVQN
jgi:hypothetical protein